MRCLLLSFLLLFAIHAVAQNKSSTILYPSEKHFKNVRQLTFGGDNAEAYFGWDNQHFVYQRTEPKEGLPCDQIFYGTLHSAKGGKFLASWYQPAKAALPAPI